MKKLLRWSLAVSSAALAFGAFAQVGQDASAPQAPAMGGPGGLTFIDSKLFDSRLSSELNTGKDRIEVEVTGKVALSSIPPRIDKWITRVGEEGTVEIREGPGRTRALFGLLPMLFSAFQQASEERMLEPARNYNATVIYRRDAGDTVIDRIVFTRRKPQ